MKQLFYLPIWFLKTRIFGQKIPLQTVLFISDLCDLKCKHCNVYSTAEPNIKTYDRVREELLYSYKLGARFVDFEGGEPFIWKYLDYNVDDLCVLAKEIGFFSTTITTNAQRDFANSKADSIWVSLDGIGKYHDLIRGEGSFDKLVGHIKTCKHKNLSVNMVVNKLNHESLEETIEYVKQSPYINSIAINFHTPYIGTETLFIDDINLRSTLIDKVIAYKKKGYPIMNSVSGLKLMKHNNFKKQCWVSNFILADGSKYAECPGKEAGICDNCGFCMAGEMHSVFSLKPDTILSALKLRIFNKN